MAGMIGLPVLLLFSGVTLYALRDCFADAGDVPLAANIITTFICAAIALFGLWLTAISLRGRRKVQGWG